MGTNVSKNITENYNENVINFSQDILNSSTQTATQNINLSQIANIEIENPTGQICVSQDINSEATYFSSISTDFQTKLENELTNSFNGFIENITEQTNEGLNLFQTNVSVNESINHNKNVSNFAQNVATEINTKAEQNINVDQNLNFKLTGPAPGPDQPPIVFNTNDCGSAKITQTIDSNATFSAVLDSSGNTESSNKIRNDTEMTVKNMTTQLNKGICLECLLAMLAIFAALLAMLPFALGAMKLSKLFGALLPGKKKAAGQQQQQPKKKKDTFVKDVSKLSAVVVLGIVMILFGFIFIDNPPWSTKSETEIESDTDSVKFKVKNQLSSQSSSIKGFCKFVGLVSVFIGICGISYLIYLKSKDRKKTKSSAKVTAIKF